MELAFHNFIKNIFNINFSGRSNRFEYWSFRVIHFAICIVFALINIPFLYLIFSLFFILPLLSIECRRLHDTGRSGWWMLLTFIPIIGFLILFFFLIQDSEDCDNEYGLINRE